MMGLGGLGLDRELGMIMNANRANPAALQGKIAQQQRAGVTPQLLEVLASQKLLKEKQEAKTALMASATPNAGTIAQQQDAMLKKEAVVDLQREVDVAKQVGMANNMKARQRQKAMTNLQKTLTGARKPRGIASAPVPKRMKAAQGGIVGFSDGALVPYGYNFGNQLIPSSNIVGTNPYAPRKEKFVPLQIDPSFTPKTDISPRTFPTIPAMTETKPVVPTFMPKGGPGTFPVPKNITKKETVEDTPKTPTPQGIKSLQYQPKDNLAAVLRAFQGGNPAAVQSLLAERDRQTKLGVDQFNIETQLAEAKIANTAEANQIDRELKEAIERGEARNALYGRLNRANESVLKAKQTFDNSMVGITINNKIAEANEKFRQNPTESRERVLQGLLTEKQQLLSQSGIDILEDTVNRINNSIQALDFDPNRSTVVTP